MASFTAMIVIDHCVSNIGTNIKKSQNQKRMKFSFTDIANISFLWKYAKTIKHEMQIYFVEIASKTPICSKCIKEHRGHEYDDLEDIYADKYALWQGEFSKIPKKISTNNTRLEIRYSRGCQTNKGDNAEHENIYEVSNYIFEKAG